MTSVVTGPDHRPPGRLVEGPHHVTAVLVSHDGSRWLPYALDCLTGQQRMPDEVWAVDTGSTDDSRLLVGRLLGHDRVLVLPRETGFGAAVAAGVARSAPPPGTDPRRAWVWLLHDDCAPASDALGRLLEEVREDVAVVGPKTREWPSLRRLLEVGATISGTGQRETGLERGEPDQGQHDEVRDVLAVNTAGLLVRRDAWDALGGLEPLLPLFGDDLDLGWRVALAGMRVRVAPAAVVFHAEAASRGLRTNSISSWSPAAQNRRAALLTLLVNVRRRSLPWQSLRLLLGGVLRVLGLLLAKAPGEALGEVRALCQVYAHPLRILAARRTRARTATRPPQEMARLLPSALLPYRHGLDTVAEVAAVLLRREGSRPSGRRAVVQTAPVGDGAHDVPTRGVLGRFLLRSWGLCSILLVIGAVWAARGLLGAEQLAGGALVAAPDGIGDWWRLVVDSWHPVGVGSETVAAPYSVFLALAGTLTFGQPWLLVDLLVLASVPLTTWSAYRLARRLYVTDLVRIAWSVSYALLPVACGALAQGRIGTLVAALVAPLVVASATDLFGPGGARSPWWQHAARIGLWLSLAVAFAPLAYALAAVGLVVPVLVRRRQEGLTAVLGALAVPWLLLGSWMWTRALSLDLVWWEAGSADVATGSDAGPGPVLRLAAGLPAGLPADDQWPIWLGLLPVLGAVVALAQRDRTRAILTAWAVALAGLAACAVGVDRRVEILGSTLTAPAWTGFALLCWSAGLLTAAALASDAGGGGSPGRRVGRGAPVATLATGAVLATALLGAGWWLSGDRTGELDRDDPVAIASYLASQAAGPVASATLVLDGSVDAGLQWSLLRDDGLRLGEESVLPPAVELAGLDVAVTGLTSNASSADVRVLLDHGVGAVYALPPVDDRVALAVDSAPGLEGSGTTDERARAWSIDAESGAVRVVPDPVAALAGVAVAADAHLVGELEVPPGDLLHLATPLSPAWRATADGAGLEAVSTASGTQGFRLSGARLLQLHHDSNRRWWVLAQLLAITVVVVLCLPGRRRGA